ncbi:HAD family hydrolase [soil metagenome]
MTGTQAVFFDFDGVIVDSVDIKTSAFVALYADCGPDITNAVRSHHLRNAGTSRYDKFRYYQRELLNAPHDEETIASLGKRFEKEVRQRVIEAAEIPGALAALAGLRERCPLFLASATPQDELRDIVAARRLDVYFSGVYGTPLRKREILASEIARHDFNPAQCFMLGDAMADHDAARANAVPFIGVVKPGLNNPFPADTEIIADLTGLVERIQS